MKRLPLLVAVLAILPGVLGAATGADLSFGYQMIDNQGSPSGPAMVWEDISTTGTDVFTGTWGPPVEQDLGFLFPFYGNLYPSCFIAADGNLQFTGPPSASGANTNVPLANTINNIIAPFWDELGASAAGTSSLKYESILGDGNPRFIVQWTGVVRTNVNGVPLTGTNPAVMTFQVKIEATGRIIFNYLSIVGALSDGTQATVGIENLDGTDGHAYRFNATPAGANLIKSGLCIHYHLNSTAPAAPVGLIQSATSSGSAQAAGFVSDAVIYFRSMVTDLEADPVRLEVEALPTTVPFDPMLVTGISATSAPGASGSICEASVTFDGLPYGNDSYHWRGRALDSFGLASPWVDFSPAPVHFWVDIEAPLGPSLIQPANGSDVVVSAPNGGFVHFECGTAPDAGPNGPLTYRFEVSQDITFSPVLTSGTSPTTTLDLWVPTSNQFHYWRARATDQVGNVGAWSSTFQFRAVHDDHVNHSAGDPARCGLSAPVSGAWTGLLGGLVLAAMLGFRRT